MPKHPILNIELDDPKLPTIETMLRDGENYATEILQIQNEDKIRISPDHLLDVWKYIDEVGGPVIFNKLRFYRLIAPVLPKEFKDKMHDTTLALIQASFDEPKPNALMRQFAPPPAPPEEPLPPAKLGWRRLFGG